MLLLSDKLQGDDVAASSGKAGRTRCVGPEQGASAASVPEVQTTRILLSPYQLTARVIDMCFAHFGCKC